MGVHIGNTGIVKVGANTVAEVHGWTLETSAVAVTTTNLAAAWETRITGSKDWKASIEVAWDETDTTGQEVLIEGASVTIGLYPEGGGAGATYHTGAAIVERRGMTVSRNNTTMISLDLVGDGALTTTTV